MMRGDVRRNPIALAYSLKLTYVCKQGKRTPSRRPRQTCRHTRRSARGAVALIIIPLCIDLILRCFLLIALPFGRSLLSGLECSVSWACQCGPAENDLMNMGPCFKESLLSFGSCEVSLLAVEASEVGLQGRVKP